MGAVDPDLLFATAPQVAAGRAGWHLAELLSTAPVEDPLQLDRRTHGADSATGESADDDLIRVSPNSTSASEAIPRWSRSFSIGTATVLELDLE